MTDVRASLALTDALHAIARWYPGTANPPRPTTTSTHGAYASKTPTPLEALSARRQCRDLLAQLVATVTRGRHLTARIDTADVPALVSFLNVHVDWIVEHEPLAVADLDKVAGTLEQIVRQTRPSRVELGPCPEHDCGGRLTAIVRQADSVLPSAVRCSLAPRDHVWEPHDWPALGRRTEPTRSTVVHRPPSLPGDAHLPRAYGTAQEAG